MKNSIKILIIMIGMCISVCGCTKVRELKTEQNDIIAEYAAGVLVKYSYAYKGKYTDLSGDFKSEIILPETEPSDEETTPEETTPDITDETTPSESAGEQETEKGKWDVSEAMGLNGLELEYRSYIITKEYPDDENAVFTFTAQEGYTFAVMKFLLVNKTGSDITVDNSELKPAVKAYFNDKAPVYNYANLMKDDITNLKNVTVTAGSSREAILVYMIEDELAEHITGIKLEYNGMENIVKK